MEFHFFHLGLPMVFFYQTISPFPVLLGSTMSAEIRHIVEPMIHIIRQYGGEAAKQSLRGLLQNKLFLGCIILSVSGFASIATFELLASFHRSKHPSKMMKKALMLLPFNVLKGKRHVLDPYSTGKQSKEKEKDKEKEKEKESKTCPSISEAETAFDFVPKEHAKNPEFTRITGDLPRSSSMKTTTHTDMEESILRSSTPSTNGMAAVVSPNPSPLSTFNDPASIASAQKEMKSPDRLTGATRTSASSGPLSTPSMRSYAHLANTINSPTTEMVASLTKESASIDSRCVPPTNPIDEKVPKFQKPKRPTAALMGKPFLVAVLRLLKIGFGETKYEKFRTCALLVVQFSLLISRTLLTIHCVRASTMSLTLAIGKGSKRAWVVWLNNFLLWTAGGVLVNSGLRYLESLIFLTLRSNLTYNLQHRYTKHNAFYILNNYAGSNGMDTEGEGEAQAQTPAQTQAEAEGGLKKKKMETGRFSLKNNQSKEKPLKPLTHVNQRIVSDVAKWSKIVAHLYGHSFKPLLEFVLSLREASLELGWLRPMMLFLSTFLASSALRLLTPPLGVMLSREAELESELSAYHTRVATSSEEIALWNGSTAEADTLDSVFRNLTQTQRWFNLERIRKTAADNLTKFLSMLTGGIFVHIPFLLTSAIDPSERMARFRSTEEIMLRSGAAFTELLLLGKDLNELSGPTERVIGVLDALEAVESQSGNDRPDLSSKFLLHGASTSLEKILPPKTVVICPPHVGLSEDDMLSIATVCDTALPRNQNENENETQYDYHHTHTMSDIGSLSTQKPNSCIILHNVTIYAPGIQRPLSETVPVSICTSTGTGSVGSGTGTGTGPNAIKESIAGATILDSSSPVTIAHPSLHPLTLNDTSPRDNENNTTTTTTVTATASTIVPTTNSILQSDGKRLLVKDLSIVLCPGTSLVITGPNGSGKTSLFRALAGLWPIFSGAIIRPPQLSAYDRLSHTIFPPGIDMEKEKEKDQKSHSYPSIGSSLGSDIRSDRLLPSAMWVPQKSYMPAGTLRDQLVYPLVLNCDTQFDERILKALKMARLETLLAALEREGGLSARSQNWSDRLSGGEKQKCAFARIFFHSPQWVILDEATAALHPRDEIEIYDTLKDCHINIISIAHRKSLFQFHTYELRLDGDGKGGYSIIDLQNPTDSISSFSP